MAKRKSKGRKPALTGRIVKHSKRTGTSRPTKLSSEFDGILHKMIRDRWASDRPFSGHTEESLRHKIASPATRELIKEQARQELAIRAR